MLLETVLEKFKFDEINFDKELDKNSIVTS